MPSAHTVMAQLRQLYACCWHASARTAGCWAATQDALPASLVVSTSFATVTPTSALPSSHCTATGLTLQNYDSGRCDRTLSQNRRGIGTTATSPTKLNDVVKLEKLQRLDRHEIAALWHRFHEEQRQKQQQHIVTQCLAASQWQVLAQRLKESPMMVVPLRKPPSQGGDAETSFVTMLSQAQLPQHLLITSLADFQLAGTNAMSHMMVTFYKELKETKDLVLVRGDLVSRNAMDIGEAGAVLEGVFDLYLKEEGYVLTRGFNHARDSFDFDALLAQFGCKR